MPTDQREIIRRAVSLLHVASSRRTEPWPQVVDRRAAEQLANDWLELVQAWRAQAVLDAGDDDEKRAVAAIQLAAHVLLVTRRF